MSRQLEGRAMFRAIDSGDEDEVMRLLNADPTLLEQETDRDYFHLIDRLTPLIYTAAQGQLGVMKLLIGRGTNVHATSADFGMTALHYAAAEGHEEVVAYLIHNGASPIQQNDSGDMPLVCASIGGHARVVMLLLEHMGGQGIETRDDLGYTALHWAIHHVHEEVVAHLLSHGARADTRNYVGTSALRDAVSKGHVGVVKLLKDNLGTQALQEDDEEGVNLLHVAIDERREDMVGFLLGDGLRPDTADSYGVTALMYAARCESIDQRDSIGILRRLLELTGGQGLDARDADGSTTLHHAVRGRDRPENVRALLLAGADPTIVDNEGRTPRLLAEANENAQSVAVFNWWDGEIERGFLLCRARALHDTHTAHQEATIPPVPCYLKARVEAELILPSVEVVEEQQQEERDRAGEGEEGLQQERHAMVEWVVGELNGELFTELMQGFHAPHN